MHFINVHFGHLHEGNKKINIHTILIFFFHFSSALPVTFKQKLRNVHVEEGNNLVLHCELSKPGVPVEWMMGGEELLNNGEKFQIKQRELVNELKILDAKPEDCNIYTCVCGNVETTASVTVMGKGLEII